jgi:preprotein translocase subunit SecF
MKYNFNYAAWFKYCLIGSTIMMAGFAYLFFFGKGLNYGVDFRGGAEIIVQFKNATTETELRSILADTNIPTSSAQSIGEEGMNQFLLKVQSQAGDLNKITTQIETSLANKVGKENIEILKTDIVGPKAGAQLRNSSFQAMFWALLGIMIYVALRFDFKYSPGAIVALLHDATFIIGAFILTQREFSLQIVAAILAIIGYSVNDTVVIYDRVREIEQANPNGDMNTIINRAVNETMSRTILTAGTTFVVCFVMFILGGGVIHDFFFALTLGVVAGTYSTVFIASPITLWFDKVLTQREQKKAPAKKSLA